MGWSVAFFFGFFGAKPLRRRFYAFENGVYGGDERAPAGAKIVDRALLFRREAIVFSRRSFSRVLAELPPNPPPVFEAEKERVDAPVAHDRKAVGPKFFAHGVSVRFFFSEKGEDDPFEHAFEKLGVIAVFAEGPSFPFRNS